MSRPEQFILNSDFATLKNDGETTFSLTFPASQVIASGATSQYTETKTVGTAGASERAHISSSKLGTRYAGNILVVTRVGSAGAYSVIADLSRTSATELTATVTVRNPYGVSMTTEAGSETFDFSVATFIPPFA